MKVRFCVSFRPIATHNTLFNITLNIPVRCCKSDSTLVISGLARGNSNILFDFKTLLFLLLGPVSQKVIYGEIPLLLDYQII